MMDDWPPERVCFHLLVDDRLMAELVEPSWGDMFWCEYTVRAVDERAERLLRTPELWNHVGFTIRHAETGEEYENCFSGGFDEFCQGKTDRLWFRSLWPFDPASVTIWTRLGDAMLWIFAAVISPLNLPWREEKTADNHRVHTERRW